MTNGDDKRFADCMLILAEAFSQELSPKKIEIYYRGLADMEIDDVEKACWSIIKTRTENSFPTVAEIRQNVLAVYLHEGRWPKHEPK